MPYGTDADARALLTASTSWAVVGLGAASRRTAHEVAGWLQQRGKRIIPVHPAGGEVLGERVYSSLADVPGPVDVVDVFRNSAHAGVHVDEALAIGAAGIWLQLGVVDEDAYARARGAGVRIVMDRCPHIDGPRLLGWPV